MDAIQRSLKTIKRCRKAIWKSLKKNNPLSCLRHKKSKRTTDNVPDGTLMLQPESMATEIDGRSEVERFPAEASFKTEEGNEIVTSDAKGQPQNDNGEVKRKRKRTNRKRRNIIKSQNATTEHVRDIVEGDGTVSRDPSPKSLIEGTLSMETATNVSQKKMAAMIDEPNESGRIPAVASSKTEEGNTHEKTTSRKLRKNAKSHNATKAKAEPFVDNDVTMSRDPSPNSPIEGTASMETATNVFQKEMAAVIDEPNESSRIPAVASSKTEAENTHEKMTSRKRRKNAKSQNTTNQQAKPFVDGDGTVSREPSPKSPIEEKATSVELKNDETEPLQIRAFGDGNHSGADRRSEPTIVINSTGDGKSRRKVVHMLLSSNTNVVLDKSENAWVLTIAAKREATNIESKTTEETNKGVRSILNKITSKNIDSMIKSFMSLPMNTVEQLQNAVDLIFEKAIQEQQFAPVYAVLCSAVKSVEVTENNRTTTFKFLLITKCQRFFESDKVRQTATARILEQIESCNDQEKKKELQFEYEENERRSRKRSVGNCCFIGELFKQHVVHPNIIQYCIAYLICQRSEEPIECLCNLLRLTGKQLEQWCDLNNTFNSLNALISVKSMSPRIRFMIRDIIDLRRRKWSPDH